MKCIKTPLIGLVSAVLAAGALPAHAALSLGQYAVTGNYALDTSAGNVSGLEASGVTYARDRGTLFYVGDEGTGVVEISKTGQTLGSMSFGWNGTGSNNHDTEGVAYLGNGRVAIGEERLQDIYTFNYSNGGNVELNGTDRVSISNVTVGNNGMEGISYDARNGGSWVTVKQQSPQDIIAGTLTFGNGTGTANMSQLFNPASLGVTTLSDVATLSAVDAFAGTADADNLLILSLGSNKLLEVTRTGQVLSSFDLSPFSHTAIEGVTVDENGTIYLVAEQEQDGSSTDPHSRLIVLNRVPEPETYSLMLGGLGMIGFMSRRKKLPV
jgi:uncharacterized protein YjiK